MSVRKKVYGFLTIVALVAALAIGGIGYFGTGQDALASADTSDKATGTEKDGKKGEEEEAIPIELAETVRGEISSFITSTANLRAVREVEVVNRTDGVVEQVLVEEGDWVEKGQILAKLDDVQLRIQLESAKQKLAQANLQTEKATIRREKAQTQIANSHEEYQRYKKLYDLKLVSEREVAQLGYQIEELEHDERLSDSEIREFRHRVDELASEIEKSKLEISRTEIKSPFSGRITKRSVESGKTVRNLDPLFTLADFSPLFADVFLSEREALKVAPDQKVTVVLGVDETSEITGRVERISPVVDQSTGTVKVSVRVAGSHGAFKPGAFVRVDIRTDTRPDALLIPKRALLEEDGESYLFIADGDKAKRVDVKLGYRSGTDVEVREGLSDGDRVVVAGQGALKDGTKLKVVGS